MQPKSIEYQTLILCGRNVHATLCAGYFGHLKFNGNLLEQLYFNCSLLTKYFGSNARRRDEGSNVGKSAYPPTSKITKVIMYLAIEIVAVL